METEKQTPKEENSSKKKGSRGLKILIFVLIVIILILLALRSCKPEEKQEEYVLERELTAELGLLPGMTEDEILDRLNRKVAESMMNISFNPTPVFPDGKSPGNLRIENIPGNSYSFTMTLIRAENNEVLLKTGVIDPGYYVENIALEVELPAGEYDCLAVFTAYDTKTLTEIGQAGGTLRLTVEN